MLSYQLAGLDPDLSGEEDVSDWFREALDSVDDVMEKDRCALFGGLFSHFSLSQLCLSWVKRDFQPSACDDSKDSAFWANVCRLALADYKAEVQELLKGVAHQDPSFGLNPF